MAKTLNQVVGYRPKAGDEQKFVDKHVIASKEDPNGNGDDVFKGSKVKVMDRMKHRHGYDVGTDDKVYEARLGEAINDNLHPAGAALLKHIKPEHHNKYKEHLTTDVFNGSYKDRTDVLNAAKKAGHLKEDAEQIDELSKTTLGSYAKKASRDAVITRKIGADFEHQGNRAKSPGMKAASNEMSQKYKVKSWKRRDGVDKAVDRLTKEEVEGTIPKTAREKDLAGKHGHPNRITFGDVLKARGVKMKKEEVEMVTEGDEAHARFQHYHNESAKLLKNIHSGLSKHYDNVTNKKGHNNGEAHWGHVGDIKDIHSSLQDIHDRILQTGEYAKPPKPIKEEVEVHEDIDTSLLNLYANLDDDNRISMVKMIDEGRKDELLEFAVEAGTE